MNKLSLKILKANVRSKIVKFHKAQVPLGFLARGNFKSFSNNPINNQEDPETHSDFKPKVKQQINDDNVMNLIDEWVKSNDVVLFMKGTKEMPRCGFSNFVIQLMNFYKVFANTKTFKVVNILENEEVREAVKKYSNWPTYPQLYVKGNLVGGCDILKEMHENGTLKDLLERENIVSGEN